MWSDLDDFMLTVKDAYNKDVWEYQDKYIEVFLEKDALSGIFADITQLYGITLCVGRGYNSWSAYKEANNRFKAMAKPVTILYFGDFDPFGDYDLLFGASRLNLKIVDLPIRYNERTYGTTNIQRWKHGFLLLKMVIVAAYRLKFV